MNWLIFNLIADRIKLIFGECLECDSLDEDLKNVEEYL